MIHDIGKLTGRTESASTLDIANKVRNLKTWKNVSPKRKIKAAYFIWKDPYMIAGGNTFINDMMQYCGFENIFVSKSRYPQIAIEEIKESGCEMILLSSEPYPFKEKHKDEMQKIFAGIKIMLVDGEMFSWYGSRLLKSADYFQKRAEIIFSISAFIQTRKKFV